MRRVFVMIKTGLTVPNILLPKLSEVSDYTAWACIACDQFTSQSDYWETLKKEVGGKISTLNLIYPEIYLSESEEYKNKRISSINREMRAYLKNGVFERLDKGFILTVRETPFVKRRIGLIGAVDLEEYDFSDNSRALVRSTEGTIEERIPPRLEIRKDAPLEFPHVMVLFDDEKREINEQLYDNRQKYRKLYDFPLNMGGGRIEGYFIDDCDSVVKKFGNLLDRERLISKYGQADGFAFAVGDGNHSLATAKKHWEIVKKTLSEKERKTHPARFALAEFNNIYDEGIYFEPIHRYVKGVDAEKFIKGLREIDCGEIKVVDSEKQLEIEGKNSLPKGILTADGYIKDYISRFGGTVDYVHGEKYLSDLVKNDKNSVGILFNKLDKKDLFGYVLKNGPFPRKTFSMGEGIEKRYYLEGRKIADD